MSYSVDFAKIKATVTYAQTIALLSLPLKKVKENQWRGTCPACKASDERSLVVTEGRGFMCFASREGGDQIALVSHVKGIQPKDAARFLLDGTTVPSTVPQSESKETNQKFPLSYLECDHPAVDAVGFDPDFAKKHGIGFAPRGTMKGFVLVPFRDERGAILGYIGVTDAKLPADFTTNVVNFKQSA